MGKWKDIEPEEEDDEDLEEEIPEFEDNLEVAITRLLEPYEPVDAEMDSDKQFTTNEIIAALETHYGVPQGDVDFHTKNAGKLVVEKLDSLGFRYVNTGGLTLQWLMKLKTKA